MSETCSRQHDNAKGKNGGREEPKKLFARDDTFPIMLTIFENVARKVTERASLVPVAPLSTIDGHVFGSDHLRSKTLLEILCPGHEHRRNFCYHPRVVVSLAVISPPSLTASGSVMEIPAKTNSNPP